MTRQPNPLVVQYLYVHTGGEAFSYPSVRSRPTATAVAERYLECALAQAASLALGDCECELALVTNTTESRTLGRRGAELLRCIESLGVTILLSEYEHRPAGDDAHYVSSRYVFDAILAAGEGQPEEQPLFMTDLDCVWVDPARMLAAVPDPPTVGCIYIEYPADGDGVGSGEVARTRRQMGALVDSLASAVERVPSVAVGTADTVTLGAAELRRRALDAMHLPRWVGGELLVGSAGTLRELVAAGERVDELMAERGETLLTEEQVLTLAGALGLVDFRELSDLAWRVHTGPRHQARLDERDVLSLALWHLPAEKGLSLRRTANAVLHGRTRSLRRDLGDPGRMARRFNVAGTGIGRRLRDDGWIAGLRLSNAARARLGGASGRA